MPTTNDKLIQERQAADRQRAHLALAQANERLGAGDTERATALALIGLLALKLSNS